MSSIALQHFEETAIRDETGRFVLRLLFKTKKSEVGGTLDMAIIRFLSIERRFQKNYDLKIQYINFIEEYLRMGHMKRVCEEADQPKYLFYLPHHPIIKLSSLTRKLQVVFDASAKSSSNVSLNDILMQTNSSRRSRRSAEIEKKFGQRRVASGDQDFQRIVWRSQPDEALKIYRLKSLTYGTRAASWNET